MIYNFTKENYYPHLKDPVVQSIRNNYGTLEIIVTSQYRLVFIRNNKNDESIFNFIDFIQLFFLNLCNNYPKQIYFKKKRKKIFLTRKGCSEPFFAITKRQLLNFLLKN